jgi:hypothetical protein
MIIFHGVFFVSGPNPVFGNFGAGTGVVTLVTVDTTTGVVVGVIVWVTVEVIVGVRIMGVEVRVGIASGVVVGGTGGGVTAHVGTLIVSALVVTVPPNDKALPAHVTLLPTVIPEASILVPANVELAPSVVAEVGVQNTSQADAPDNVTTELATVVSAPFILKMYAPAPERVIPLVPMDAAPDVQYTPGV